MKTSIKIFYHIILNMDAKIIDWEDESICIEYYEAKFWYKNGILHRLSGPAIEYKNGQKEWRIEGIRFMDNAGSFYDWGDI